MTTLTDRHKAYNLALRDKAMYPTIAYGAAGTGKTYSACEAAVEWLKRDKRSRVLVIRPNVSFADKNGFLPGTEREKMEPWIRPVSQHFSSFGLHSNEQDCLEKKGRLTYLPLEHIQGLTFDNTFVLVDEVQNMTFAQLKVLLTRMGKWSKLVLCGDVAQVSPKFQGSGLAELLDMVDRLGLPVNTIEFTEDDILRSNVCKQFIIAFNKWEG